MKGFLVACSLLACSVAFADIGEMDNNKTITVDCKKDPTVRVSGNENTFTLTGTCAAVQLSGNKNTIKGDGAKSVQISGNENSVTLTTIDSIMVTGDKNSVAWTKTSGKAKKPSIQNTGEQNKLAAAK